MWRSGTGRAFLLAGFLLLAVVIGWSVAPPKTPELSRLANLEAPGDLLVFFGDRITRGYGVRPQESLPVLVARELGVAYANAGVPGDRTAAGLARIGRDVLAHRPRFAVVEFGGNDFLRGVPLEETLSNLDAMVKMLVGEGMMVAVLEVDVGLMSDPYLEGFRRVANRHGALLVEDIMKGILGNPELQADAVHPNARGHRLIADRVAAALRPLLREADRRRGLRVGQWLDFLLPDLGSLDTLRVA